MIVPSSSRAVVAYQFIAHFQSRVNPSTRSFDMGQENREAIRIRQLLNCAISPVPLVVALIRHLPTNNWTPRRNLRTTPHGSDGLYVIICRITHYLGLVVNVVGVDEYSSLVEWVARLPPKKLDSLRRHNNNRSADS